MISHVIKKGSTYQNAMKNNIVHTCDVLVIGCGAAGLSLALSIANRVKVIVLSKGSLRETATHYAQGGIAAALAQEDSIDCHIRDTHIAGAGLCDPKTVAFTAKNAHHAIDWLIAQGVCFDQINQPSGTPTYHLRKEGGHSHRRIFHAADATGKIMQNTLLEQALMHPNIVLLAHYNAIDLISTITNGTQYICGSYVWNIMKARVETIAAHFTVLATGGASKVYQYTSNPDISSGDGIAMAWRAGCRVANMEFNQFHPTSLYHPKDNNFLLTEALRGEGALLKRPDGTRFMPDFDSRAELAPRDIVARAIDFEMKRLGVDCMYLDISHRSADFIKKHFPTIYQRCLALDINITKAPMPVVPAAHYTCGGVMVNDHGCTDIHHLYAIGEVSYTGLHGANRMASNSLLECVVYGQAAAQDILSKFAQKTEHVSLPSWDESRVVRSHEDVIIQHNWHELRLIMWDYVGIVRTNKRLQQAKRRIDLIWQEVNDYYTHFKISHNLLELRNLIQVATLIVESAQQRMESRGLHYNLDYPEQQDNPTPTILNPTTTSRINGTKRFYC